MESGSVIWPLGGCAKSSPAADAYHALLLLWPDADDWPSGGEIDFMDWKLSTRHGGAYESALATLRR